MGMVVAVWSNSYRRQGSSTFALSLATILECMTYKKVLLIDMDSKESIMDKFIERDIEIKEGLDEIKVYKDMLDINMIKNHLTKINDNMYIVKKNETDCEVNKEFCEKFIEICKKNFDLVVIKINNKIVSNCRELVNNVDELIYVTEANPILIEDVLNQEYFLKIKDKKDIITIINKVYKEQIIHKKILKDIIEDKNKVYFIPYDTNLYIEANYERKMYSYIVRSYNEKTEYIKCIKKVCEYILNKNNFYIHDSKIAGGNKKWKIKLF